jgi:hypothetical protein
MRARMHVCMCACVRASVRVVAEVCAQIANLPASAAGRQPGAGTRLRLPGRSRLQLHYHVPLDPWGSLTVSGRTSGALTSTPIRLFFLVPPKSAKSLQLATRSSRLSSHAWLWFPTHRKHAQLEDTSGL